MPQVKKRGPIALQNLFSPTYILDLCMNTISILSHSSLFCGLLHTYYIPLSSLLIYIDYNFFYATVYSLTARPVPLNHGFLCWY